MALLRIINGFDKQSDAKLIERAHFIHQQVSTRPAVFPSPVPTMPDLKAASDDLFAAVQAAGSGDRVLVSQKNVVRQQLIDNLHQLSHYVLMIANGDRQVAVASGFALAKEPTPAVITKPVDLKVEYGDQAGELLVSVKKVKGAAAYIHQYTTDPLLQESTWKGMNCTASKCKIAGLTPGTTYFLRVAAIGTKDQVLYSDVTSKMAA